MSEEVEHSSTSAIQRQPIRVYRNEHINATKTAYHACQEDMLG